MWHESWKAVMIYTATSDWLSIIGLTKKHDDMTKLTNHTKTALQRHIVSSTENLKDYKLVAKAEKKHSVMDNQ